MELESNFDVPFVSLARNSAITLLIDEKLADQVWDVWDKGEIDDQVAWLAWTLIALIPLQTENFLLS